jgi:hypothetical protein
VRLVDSQEIEGPAAGAGLADKAHALSCQSVLCDADLYSLRFR